MLLSISLLSLPLCAQAGGGLDEVHMTNGFGLRQFHGAAVVELGDVNADGYTDYGIGQPGANRSSRKSGSIKVYSGIDHSLLWTVSGQQTSGFTRFGGGLSRYPDYDGDGADDILAKGAHQIQLHSGRTGTLLQSFPISGYYPYGGLDPVLTLSDLDGDGTADFAVGERWWTGLSISLGRVQVKSLASKQVIFSLVGTEAGGRFGATLAHLPDLNGDGLEDLAIGAPNEDGSATHNDNGRVHIVSGADGQPIHTLLGANQSDKFGSSLLRIHDADGDGLDDFLVGAKGTQAGGSVYCYSSSTFQVLWSLHGDNASGKFGYAMCTIPDQDGDGTAELAIGSPGEQKPNGSGDSGKGRVRIFSGATQALLHVIHGANRDDSLGEALVSYPLQAGSTEWRLLAGMPNANPSLSGRHRVYAISPFLTATADNISASAGGTIDFEINFPERHSDWRYQLLGSYSGIGPTLYGVDVPLTSDGLFQQSILGGFPGYIKNHFGGLLNSDGEASCTLVFVPNNRTSLVGRTLHAAAVAYQKGSLPQISSRPVGVTILP